MDIHVFTATNAVEVELGISAKLAEHDHVQDLRISMVSHGGLIVVVMTYRL